MATFESAIEDQDLEAVLELLDSKPRPSQQELNKALAFAVDPELGLPDAVVPLFDKRCLHHGECLPGGRH